MARETTAKAKTKKGEIVLIPVGGGSDRTCVAIVTKANDDGSLNVRLFWDLEDAEAKTDLERARRVTDWERL